MTSTTMKPRASLTVRIVLAVMAALLVMAALWAIVNLAAVNSYNQATQNLQENIMFHIAVNEKDKKMFAVVKNEEGGFNIICYVL